MKTLKFLIFIILSMLIVSSCGKNESTQEAEDEVINESTQEAEGKIDPEENYMLIELPTNFHSLLLNFQDASGNDLIRNWQGDITPIAAPGKIVPFYAHINYESYKLDVVVYEDALNVRKVGYRYWPLSLHFGEVYSEMAIGLNPSYDYLSLRADCAKEYFDETKRVELPFVEKIMFKLTCPYLFGDYRTRDIITWWKPRPIDDNSFNNDDRVLCYRIEIDGKEITEIYYVAHDMFSVATIVLDR